MGGVIALIANSRIFPKWEATLRALPPHTPWKDVEACIPGQVVSAEAVEVAQMKRAHLSLWDICVTQVLRHHGEWGAHRGKAAWQDRD